VLLKYLPPLAIVNSAVTRIWNGRSVHRLSYRKLQFNLAPNIKNLISYQPATNTILGLYQPCTMSSQLDSGCTYCIGTALKILYWLYCTNCTALTVLHKVGFEVLTAVSTKMAGLWVVAPCSLAEVNQRFRGPCCLNQPWWWRQQGPLKRCWTSTRIHSATTQKTAILVLH
jgi:hypothetical protein